MRRQPTSEMRRQRTALLRVALYSSSERCAAAHHAPAQWPRNFSPPPTCAQQRPCTSSKELTTTPAFACSHVTKQRRRGRSRTSASSHCASAAVAACPTTARCGRAPARGDLPQGQLYEATRETCKKGAPRKWSREGIKAPTENTAAGFVPCVISVGRCTLGILPGRDHRRNA